MTTREIFAKKVTKARSETDFTQAELAEKVGVNVQTYRAYESARAFPRPDIIDRLSEVLGKPIHWFFQATKTPKDLIADAEKVMEDMNKMLARIKAEES